MMVTNNQENNNKSVKISNKKESTDSLNAMDLWVFLDEAHYTVARSHIIELVRSGITRNKPGYCMYLHFLMAPQP